MRQVNRRLTFNKGRGQWCLGEMIDPLPQAPLYSVLRWILDHINAGCSSFVGEGDGQPAHSVVLGQMASSEASSAEEAIKEVTQRHLAVNFAGVLATARERGVEPEYADLVEKTKLLATVNAKMNTDFHYAYELVNILKRISHRTFVFDAPPIIGRADPQTMDLLQEATRCYLFGLHRACVTVCRTVMEDSLKQRVPRPSLLEEGMQSGKSGDLERLINAAVRARVLPPEFRKKAHDIRQLANDVLHKADRDVPDPWPFLLDTRTIVDAVHTRPRA